MRNISVGLKFTVTALIVTVLFTFIAAKAVGTIMECHHACGMLMSGAMVTKSAVQSLQTEFEHTALLGNRALLAAQNGKDSSALAEEFKKSLASVSANSGSVLTMLKADGLMDAESISRISSQISRAEEDARGVFL